jgi:hypothetical protein
MPAKPHIADHSPAIAMRIHEYAVQAKRHERQMGEVVVKVAGKKR